ncbi:unnamed protein product, partial [Mesorhabditis spiculigera]
MCIENRDSIVAANDLRNFRRVVVDEENFCKNYADVSKCGAECQEEAELTEKIRMASEICRQKDLGAARGCLEKDEEEPVNSHHICVLQCSTRLLSTACPAAAQLFKDLLKFQINNGVQGMEAQKSKAFFAALPEECNFMKSTDDLEKLISVDISKVTAPVNLEEKFESSTIRVNVDEETSKFEKAEEEEKKDGAKTDSDEFTLSEALDSVESTKTDGEKSLVSSEDETEIPRVVVSSSEVPAIDEEAIAARFDAMNKDRKPDEPLFLASRDAKPEEEPVDEATTHAFQPEDDFVPFGTPGNATEDAAEVATENPAVAQTEEDVKIVNQPTTPAEKPLQIDGETESEEVTAKMEVISSEETEEAPVTVKAEKATSEDDRSIQAGLAGMEHSGEVEKNATDAKEEEKKEEATTEPMLVVNAQEEEHKPEEEASVTSEVITQSPEPVSSSNGLSLGVVTLISALMFAF